MPIEPKREAIAQITRAVRGLEVAIDKLQEAYYTADFDEQGELLELITELGERLDVNRIFLAHIKAAEVEVMPPADGAYTDLDSALADLQQLEVQSAGITRALEVAATVAGTIRDARREVSARTT